MELSGDLLFVPPAGAVAGWLLGLGLGAILAGEPTPLMLGLAVLGAFGGAIGMANTAGIPQEGWEPQLEALADRLAALLQAGPPYR